MKEYIVSTHLGEFRTMAASAAKALSNIRFRIFGRSPAAKRYTVNWTVCECA